MSLPSGRNHRPFGFGSLGAMARDSAGGAAPSRVSLPSPNSPAGMPGCLFPVRSQSTRQPIHWWDGGLPAPHFLSPVPVWIAPPLIPMLKPPVFMTFTGSHYLFPRAIQALGNLGLSAPRILGTSRFGYTTALSGLQQGAGSRPAVKLTTPSILRWEPRLSRGPKGGTYGDTPLGIRKWAHHLPARLLFFQSAPAKTYVIPDHCLSIRCQRTVWRPWTHHPPSTWAKGTLPP